MQDKPVSLPDVVGKQVRHKTYGVGVVQSNDNGTLLVHFEKADKKFKYPSVFTQGFLSFAGEETQTGEKNRVLPVVAVVAAVLLGGGAFYFIKRRR